MRVSYYSSAFPDSPTLNKSPWKIFILLLLFHVLYHVLVHTHIFMIILQASIDTLHPPVSQGNKYRSEVFCTP
jgi:hypothetical protein